MARVTLHASSTFGQSTWLSSVDWLHDFGVREFFEPGGWFWDGVRRMQPFDFEQPKAWFDKMQQDWTDSSDRIGAGDKTIVTVSHDIKESTGSRSVGTTVAADGDNWVTCSCADGSEFECKSSGGDGTACCGRQIAALCGEGNALSLAYNHILRRNASFDAVQVRINQPAFPDADLKVLEARLLVDYEAMNTLRRF